MSTLYRKYVDDKTAFRKKAGKNGYAINPQFLIELAGFKTLLELSDQMNISWFKQADKVSREAALDLSLLLDSSKASRILEAATGFNPKILSAEHRTRAAEILIGFGQVEKAIKLGLEPLQQLDAENPFRNQSSKLESKTSWLRKFLEIGPRQELEYTEDRFSHPVDSFEITNTVQNINLETITVAIIAQRPGQQLIRTVKSALASSESPLEILVMQQLDTAKGYRAPIDVQRFSPNVKTVMVNEELKLHQILNRALDESSGKYLCVLNQGEILHPDALGILKPRARKVPIATAKKQFIGLGFELTQVVSELGVINKELAKNFGYFDHIRIGSQESFIERLEPKRKINKTLCFSTDEKPEDLLVQDATRHYLALQKAFVKNQSRPFVTNSPIRSFYAPRPVRFGFKLSVKRRELDFVVALDMTDNQSLQKLDELITPGKIIGIWDLNPFWSKRDLVIPPKLLAQMNQRTVQFVYPEELISIDKLLVLDSLALEAQNPKRKPKWDVVDFEFDVENLQALKNLFPVSEV